MPYTFLDADGSILTARSSITSGSAQEPLVTISSFLTAVPTTASGNQSVSGTVNTVNTTPSSMLVGASIFGQLPAGTALLGSVATLQSTNPWIMTGSVQGFPTNQNVSGSVVAFLSGANSSSIYGMRNDAIASFFGANLTIRPIAVDSAGRIVNKPFSPEESRIEGYASTVNVSVTTLVAAAGLGLRNYITDVWLANTGAATTLVTFRSGGGTSVLGYTIAPTASGSNLPGLVTPMRTLANETFDFQASTGTSVLYATVKGFIGP